jgi:glutamine amidotransferase
MCRWLAYSGPPIFLDELIVKPSRSLLVQSRFARENWISVPGIPEGDFPTNGDGFGIGWYGERDWPGLYRDLRPAWSDHNLLHLAQQIRSGLFMAHLRAAIHGIVQRTNSHPFRHGRWLFQHNGEIPGFPKLKRTLQMLVREDLFPEIAGTTDSETFFYLALTRGLEEDPKGALERAVADVEQLRGEAEITEPFTLTCALSDGANLYAVRYSSNRRSKTLYVNEDRGGMKELMGDQAPRLPGHIVLSEPLDDCGERWHPVPESSFVTVHRGRIDVQDFRPSA